MHRVTLDAEPDLRVLIAARRAELHAQVKKLSQQLQEVRNELEELTVAEPVARQLAEQLHAETEREATPSGAAGQLAGRGVLLVPQRERDMDESCGPSGAQDR